MALFRPILGDLSGSIHNNVFSNNKGGAYVRRRAVAVNPTTPRQTKTRASLAYVSAQWQTLTATQRQAWSDYAQTSPQSRSGRATPQLTGHQTFVQLNSVLNLIGVGSQANPPVTTLPPDLTFGPLVFTAPAVLSVSFIPTPTNTNRAMIVRVTRPTTAGVNPNEHSNSDSYFVGFNSASPAILILRRQYPAGKFCSVFCHTVDDHGRIQVAHRFDLAGVGIAGFEAPQRAHVERERDERGHFIPADTGRTRSRGRAA